MLDQALYEGFLNSSFMALFFMLVYCKGSFRYILRIKRRELYLIVKSINKRN